MWSRQREQNVQRPRGKREHTVFERMQITRFGYSRVCSRGIVTKEARASW